MTRHSRISLRIALLLSLAWPVIAVAQPSTGRWDDVPLTNLRAAIVQVDITPEGPVQLAGYAERTTPSTGVHDPLKASVLVFDDGEQRAVIIGLDAIMMLQDWGDRIRTAVEERSGIPGDYVLLNASHTHGAPHPRQEPDYVQMTVQRISDAVVQAIANLRPVSIGYGEGLIDFNINRRTIGPDGKATGKLNPQGVVDQRVKVLRIDDGNAVEPMAVVMHAACHPNIFRGENTEISADFSGIGRAFVERNFDNKTTGLFLQGCAGDIRANMPPVDGGWRNGSAADMTWCAYSLGAEVIKVTTGLRVREQMQDRPAQFEIAAAADTLYLEPDPRKMQEGVAYRDRIDDGKIVFPIRAMAIGDFLFVALPGEPVVEYGLRIEEDLAHLGKVVFVLGYATGDNGYVPVERMIDEGGYEAEGPYHYSSEMAIREGIIRLVNSMYSGNNQ